MAYLPLCYKGSVSVARLGCAGLVYLDSTLVVDLSASYEAFPGDYRRAGDL